MEDWKEENSSWAMTNGSVPPPSEMKILEKPITKQMKNADLMNIHKITIEDWMNDSSLEQS